MGNKKKKTRKGKDVNKTDVIDDAVEDMTTAAQEENGVITEGESHEKTMELEEKGDEGGDEKVEKEEEEDPDTIGGFSMLGNFSNTATKPVKRELPDWLANPVIIQDSRGLKRKRREESDGDGDIEEEDAEIFQILDDDLIEKLRSQGINNFFPVQQAFIPDLWQDLRFTIFGGRCGFRPGDICVSAPTGSGKTLSYVLPIVQTLQTRLVPHIYVLVVLPVRDLAEQVYSVFCQYAAVKGLKVGLVVGKTTTKVEQEHLVKTSMAQYHSLVDIVVATPGRLLDHIRSTPGFDLSHLRFLVVDEADRMMEERSDWLEVVESAVYSPKPDVYFPYARTRPDPIPTYDSMQCKEMPLQKLLFSATLSHNPEKLHRMNLYMPRLMTSVVASTPSSNPARQQTEEGEEEDAAEEAGAGFMGKYTTPQGLTEYIVETKISEKPLMILHFLQNLKFRNVLCFTNSVESTHRLCLLVKLYDQELKVREFSSRLPADRRKKILRQFTKGKIDMLVCSDAMARGMDVESVRYVISYDHPPYVKTYIHRVGRTARAGRAGTAISLLEKKEFFHFKKMMRDAGKWSKIHEMKVGRHALKPMEKPFQEALGQLSDVIKKEKRQS